MADPDPTQWEKGGLRVNPIDGQTGVDGGDGDQTDATTRVTLAGNDPAVVALEAIQAGSIGVAVTYDAPLKIAQGATPALLSLKTGAGIKVVRLHALVGTLHAAGTLKVSYADNAGTTNEVDLTGVMTFAKNGFAPTYFQSNPDGCLKTLAGKFLTITTDVGAFNGWCITSTADS